MKFPPSQSVRQPAQQQGVALAIALFLLVIITLIGATAVRTSQLQAKMAGNSENQVSAQLQAQSVVDFLVNNASVLDINAGENYVLCSNAPISIGGYACTNNGNPLPLTTFLNNTRPNGESSEFRYGLVRREQPAFVGVESLREAGNSARSYNYARFTGVGGFDRTSEGRGAAEVTQEVLVLNSTGRGLVEQ